MTEKRRKQIVYSIFVIAVIWFIWNFTTHERVVVENRPPTTAGMQTAAMTTPLLQTQPGQTQTSRTREWGRDPFARANRAAALETQESSTDFHVAAVSESNGRLLAMINGHMVGKGDRIGEWQVLDLTKSQVVLICKGQKITLNIGG